MKEKREGEGMGEIQEGEKQEDRRWEKRNMSETLSISLELGVTK